MTTISAIGLGADTQIKFRKINTKQQNERRYATYSLAAVAMSTACIAAALFMKVKPGEGASHPLSLFTEAAAAVPEAAVTQSDFKTTVMKFLLAGTSVTGLGLAIDKGVNGKKRAPAAQKKRDIAMGVLLAISGVVFFSGLAYEKQDAIKGAFANKYPTVTEALSGDGVNADKIRAAKAAIEALKTRAPPELTKFLTNTNSTTNPKNIQDALNSLTLKGRTGAALGKAAGYASAATAGLFVKTDQSLSWPRIGSAGLLLASIIILAVLKSQKKLKPAPKPGKPGKPAPSKVPPGEIVMYVMISVSVLMFVLSYLKDRAQAQAPQPQAQAQAPAAQRAAIRNMEAQITRLGGLDQTRQDVTGAIGELQTRIAEGNAVNAANQAAQNAANQAALAAARAIQ
jgi:hypothetical protein